MTTPPMTFEMAQALRNEYPLVIIAEIEHPDGPGRFWSGTGNLYWNSSTWTGTGVLGSVTPIRHTTNLAIQEIEFTLAGIDADTLDGLSDDVRNLSGQVWLACLDTRGNVIDDPFQIVDAQLDYQSCKVSDDGINVIVVTARTGFYTLERALDDRWTAEDHKRTYPDDSGLDLISSLQNQDLLWGPS